MVNPAVGRNAPENSKRELKEEEAKDDKDKLERTNTRSGGNSPPEWNRSEMMTPVTAGRSKMVSELKKINLT